MTKSLRKNDIQILSDIAHVLKRPGMYCGNINEEVRSTYIYENGTIVQKDIPQIPALLKLFDEICSNSLDEAIRTNFKYATKIKIDFEPNSGKVTVEDNGRGLPIELDTQFKKWTPELIFTHLKSGSNFDDTNNDMVVGQNGVGGSLVPIFSKKFKIDTANGHKSYTQTIENHIELIHKPTVGDSSKNYTIITYEPDYDYFKVSDEVKENLSSLYYKRIKDLAFCYPEISFTFGKEKISVPKLKEFVSQIHDVYEANEVDGGRIAIFCSETEFQQMSFVNGSNTTKGGTHIDYAMPKIIEYIRAFLKKKHKLDVKPIDIKSRMFLLLSIRMSNPRFDSQIKTELTSPNNFKTLIDELLSEKFLKSILTNDEIILPIVEAYKLKLQVKENIDLKKLNQNKKKLRIDKYYPAVGDKTYIVLCEGDSALGFVQPALGRSIYSYFPLKGKPLNSLEVKLSKIMENDEIKNIISILNLRMDKDIQTDLTHKYILFATDADADSHHIKALLLTLFNRFAPSLIRENRIKFLRTPLFIGRKNGKVCQFFFDVPSYKEFDKTNTIKYDWQYIKGLGTLKSEEMKLLFDKHGIEHFIQDFDFDDTTNDCIQGWMAKGNVDYRKDRVLKNKFDINGV